MTISRLLLKPKHVFSEISLIILINCLLALSAALLLSQQSLAQTQNKITPVISFLLDDAKCSSTIKLKGNRILQTQAHVDAFKGVGVLDGDLMFNTSLALDLSPMDELNEITGGISFPQNNQTSVSGFPCLKQVQSILINNPVLQHLDGFESLESMPIGLAANVNESLVSLPDFLSLKSIGNIGIYNNPLLERISGFPALTTIGGSLEIQTNRDLNTISGFNALSSVGNLLDIQRNENLTTLQGFSKLTESNIRLSGIVDNARFDCKAAMPNFAPLTTSRGNLKNCTTTYTSTPNLAIPDHDGINPGGIFDFITVPSQGLGLTVQDIKVKLNISHTYVGDLSVVLTKIGGVSSSTLLNRPKLIGTVGDPQACSGDNINTTFSDDSFVPAHTFCSSTAPALGPDTEYEPFSSLSLLDNETVRGEWRLSVFDNSQQDTGVLHSWEIEITK